MFCSMILESLIPNEIKKVYYSLIARMHFHIHTNEIHISFIKSQFYFNNTVFKIFFASILEFFNKIFWWYIFYEFELLYTYICK